MTVSILFFIFLQACISLPDVYVVDQATVLQGGCRSLARVRESFQESSTKKNTNSF